MRLEPYTKFLLIVLVFVVGLGLYATEQAFYYRGLYHDNPRVRVEEHNRTNTVYAKFDPNRSQAYTCTTQSVTDDHIGMVCDSPDGNISISCTVATGDTNPSHYFC